MQRAYGRPLSSPREQVVGPSSNCCLSHAAREEEGGRTSGKKREEEPEIHMLPHQFDAGEEEPEKSRLTSSTPGKKSWRRAGSGRREKGPGRIAAANIPSLRAPSGAPSSPCPSRARRERGGGSWAAASAVARGGRRVALAAARRVTEAGPAGMASAVGGRRDRGEGPRERKRSVQERWRAWPPDKDKENRKRKKKKRK
ncbi:hypothetical protein PR202_gb24013 [Eleusine coracana subsp. coracana]|uniref:Uncharacterized protein n=1 Tax=Eleusine coracana subsp. coracana TaxID=191504 RepID=A0AAV5FJR9_ELECO|nr:hypothetical protein PR202_gb24013 [Eleusine coracana subsp. coracana]